MADNVRTAGTPAETNIPVRRKWLSEGFLLAAIPFLGYLITYWYELGYAETFGISSDFVEVSFTTVLFLITVFGFGTLLVLTVIADILEDLELQNISPLRKTILLFYSVIVGCFFIVLFFFDARTKSLLAVSITIGLIALLVFLLPLFRRSTGGRSYSERFADFYTSAHLRDRQSQPNSSLARKFKTGFYLVAFLLIFIVHPFAKEVGKTKANNQVNFNVLTNEPNTVLLRVYGDKLLTAKYDPNTKEILDEISIRTFSDNKPMHLRQLPIGPFTVKVTNKTNREIKK